MAFAATGGVSQSIGPTLFCGWVFRFRRTNIFGLHPLLRTISEEQYKSTTIHSVKLRETRGIPTLQTLDEFLGREAGQGGL